MTTLIVGGTFDDRGGRPSGYVKKLFERLADPKVKIVNGGTWQALEDLVKKVKRHNLIFWLADVDNQYPKLLSQIKEQNPRCILVTSKRNFGDQYSYQELVGRALAVKSNLMLVFTNGAPNPIAATVLDPLGNAFCLNEADISTVRNVLFGRVRLLRSLHRVQSQYVDVAMDVPDQRGFFAVAKDYATVFHTLIHGVRTDRFLGNLSFRCERGFSSFRKDNLIYVSQRNIDKRHITRKNFVAVDADSTKPLYYYGDNKPSVDTPIQVQLYDKYPNIRYMLHSHVYIVGAPMTTEVLPCGAIEEATEIIYTLGEFINKGACVNLKGHGSLIMCENVSYLRGIAFQARPVPEVHWR